MKKFNGGSEEESSHLNSHYGGGEEDDMDETKRYFKIVELNGQPVDFGRLGVRKITKAMHGNPGGKPGPGPLGAARKALTSITEHLGMTDKPFKVNVEFMIKETTRGSKGKVFGPYKGYFREYTAAEKKAAFVKTPSGKKQGFTKEAIVKLIKKKNNKKKNNK